MNYKLCFIFILLSNLFISSIYCDDENTKYILLYTTLGVPIPNWENSNYIKDERTFEKQHCKETNCVITSNRTYLGKSLQDFDMVALNSWRILSSDVIPPQEGRRPDQIYLVNFHESPVRTKPQLSNYSNIFNWTMSFRLDADVVQPYGYIITSATNEVIAPNDSPNWRDIDYNAKIVQDQNVISLVESKEKMAAWFVSSCQSPSQRKLVVKKLQEFIPVDIYGKCGTQECPKDNRILCRELVEKDYKFYLSFENSLCTDYVTEKVFEMMKYYVIPVVYGGANYTRFLPPGSYIDVLDYESVADLADHLQFLANNTNEYMKYFWWKDYYQVQTGLNFCSLCEKISRDVKTHQSYTDLDQWFKKDSCVDPEDIPLVRNVLVQYNRIK